VPACPRHTCRLPLAAGLLASSSSRTAVSSSPWPRWASPKRRSANHARSSGSPGRPSTGTSQRTAKHAGGRRTSALSKVETDPAFERPRTKDVRRAKSPFAAPVNAAGGAYGNWARPGSSGDRRRGDDRQTFVIRGEKRHRHKSRSGGAIDRVPGARSPRPCFGRYCQVGSGGQVVKLPHQSR
jgi:hypothetical protein